MNPTLESLVPEEEKDKVRKSLNNEAANIADLNEQVVEIYEAE